MKNSLLISFLVISSFCIGQDYQTIRSNQINYFGTTSNDYFLATRTDSVVLSGNDSILYSYKSLRPVGQSGDLQSGPNWYGSKVIIKDDGRNLFFNKNNDTITIQTLAPLNDTFTIYTYPNGEWIKGWVSSITEEFHLGQTDSIKTISLFTNSTSYQLNFYEFRIGKNIGFINAFPFYSFPEIYNHIEYVNDPNIVGELTIAGSETPKFGVTRLTIGDLHDYEIGDIIHYYKRTISPFWGVEGQRTVNLKYTNKTQWNTDSVKYELKIRTADYYYNNGYIEYTINQSNTSSIMIYKLDSFFHATLPEEFAFDTINNYQRSKFTTLTTNPNCQNLLVETVHDEEMEYFPNTGFFSYGFSYPKQYAYRQKAGGPYISGYTYNGDMLRDRIVFQSNSNGSCGIPWYLDVDENEMEKIDFTIFPNPFTNKFTIQANTNSFEDVTINIINLQGLIVHSTIQTAADLNAGLTLNLGQVASGQYILQIINESASFNKKIVKL